MEQQIKRLPRVGIDVDGVLAQFDRPFAYLLKELGCPVDFPTHDPQFPNQWDWDVAYMKDAGMDDEAIAALQAKAWTAVKRSTAFWCTLPEYPTTRQDLLYLRACIENGWDVYFLTARPGITAKFQTEAWLASKGIKIPFVPTVLITENAHVNKPRMCKALELDAIIDDRPSNLAGIVDPTHRFLMQRPWNRDHTLTDVIEVTTVKDMLQLTLERLG